MHQVFFHHTIQPIQSSAPSLSRAAPLLITAGSSSWPWTLCREEGADRRLPTRCVIWWLRLPCVRTPLTIFQGCVNRDVVWVWPQAELACREYWGWHTLPAIVLVRVENQRLKGKPHGEGCQHRGRCHDWCNDVRRRMKKNKNKKKNSFQRSASVCPF